MIPVHSQEEPSWYSSRPSAKNPLGDALSDLLVAGGDTVDRHTKKLQFGLPRLLMDASIEVETLAATPLCDLFFPTRLALYFQRLRLISGVNGGRPSRKFSFHGCPCVQGACCLSF